MNSQLLYFYFKNIIEKIYQYKDCASSYMIKMKGEYV